MKIAKRTKLQECKVEVPKEVQTKPKLTVVENKPEPEYDKLSVTLVNTENKAESLIKKLQLHEGMVGFDTEVVGPQLRGVDFVNITRATLLGLSLAFEGNKRAYYIPVYHKGNNIEFRHLDAIMRELQKLAAAGKVVAHNAKFDAQAVRIAGYELPGLLDSMVLAWLATGRNKGIGLKDLAQEVLNRKSPPFDPAMGSKTGDQVKQYAGHDAKNTLDLMLHEPWQEIAKSDWFKEECCFAGVLAGMKLQGMRIDADKLRKVRDRAQAELDRILGEWEELAKDVSITSSKSLQELFIDGTWEIHGETAGGQCSTAKGAMEHNVEHARTENGRKLARLRLEYQEVAKIVSTYTTGLIEEARQWADGKLHADLFHFGTVTGRLASANPNLQNQPAHGEWAAAIRECFIPDPGYVFTAADYSQIELRLFADYCGGKLLEMYQTGADLHAETGEVFTPYVDDPKLRRDMGKRVNFGFMLYGGGPGKLQETVLEMAGITITLDQAKGIVAELDEKYPAVAAWKQRVIKTVGGEVEWDGYGKPHVVGGRGMNPAAKTIAGRERAFPELDPDYFRAKFPEEYTQLKKKYNFNCKKRGKRPSPSGLWMSVRARGERLLINYIVQGGARDLLVKGMNNYVRNRPATDFQLVMTVHDEVLTQHREDQTDLAQELLKSSLEMAGEQLGLTVPLVAEPKTGKHWGEVK